MYMNTTGKYNIFTESLESYYWIGFILADGHIHNNKTITIKLGLQDINHLLKFKTFTKSKHSIKLYDYSLNNFSPKGKYCEFQISDKIHIPPICNKFDIKSNKTLQPPNIVSNTTLTNNQYIALIIGYIDGDGCITVPTSKRKYPTIRLEAHSSWFNNYMIIEQKLCESFDIKFRNKLTKINSRGYTQLIISKQSMIIKLKEFAITYNLPILDRKWTNIIMKQQSPY